MLLKPLVLHKPQVKAQNSINIIVTLLHIAVLTIYQLTHGIRPMLTSQKVGHN